MKKMLVSATAILALGFLFLLSGQSNANFQAAHYSEVMEQNSGISSQSNISNVNPEINSDINSDVNSDVSSDINLGSVLQEKIKSNLRLAGVTRYETSRLIAECYKDGPVESVIIVSGKDYAGAISAAPLAAKLHAPILLSKGSYAASKDCVNYLTKHLNKGGTVFIIGGEDQVSQEFEANLSEYQVRRIAGESIYETNLLLAGELNVPAGTPVFIVSGESFPDALSVASIASLKGYPIVFIDQKGIKTKNGSYHTENNIGSDKESNIDNNIDNNMQCNEGANIECDMEPYLTKQKPQTIYVVGGLEQIPSEAEEQLRLLVPGVQIERIAGRDRFDTAIQVIKKFIDEPKQLYLASGYNFADAISGTVLAAQAGSPILLLHNEKIEPPLEVDLYLNDLFKRKISPALTVFGGERVITNSLLENVQKIIYIGYETEQIQSYHALKSTGVTEVDLIQVVPPKPNKIESIVISGVGDCTLGIDPRYSYSGSLPQSYDQNGPDYFLSGVKDYFQKDDLTIANLETALTESTVLADKSMFLYKYWFSGEPSYTDILTKGSVEAVCTANNHSEDFREQGYLDTLEALEEAKIAHFGNGQKAIIEVKGIKIGLLAFNLIGLIPNPTVDEIKKEVSAVITRIKAECDMVIVSYHWGIENSYGITDVQRDLAHFTIDQGADLILGHHPHVLEPIEQYQGKYIVYSLGNFVFGGNYNPWDKDTAIFQQSLKLVNGEYWGLGEVDVIPCRLSTVTYKNDYRPVPVESDEDKKRILGKLKW